jgi:hypothetical protein
MILKELCNALQHRRGEGGTPPVRRPVGKPKRTWGIHEIANAECIFASGTYKISRLIVAFPLRKATLRDSPL